MLHLKTICDHFIAAPNIKTNRPATFENIPSSCRNHRSHVIFIGLQLTNIYCMKLHLIYFEASHIMRECKVSINIRLKLIYCGKLTSNLRWKNFNYVLPHCCSCKVNSRKIQRHKDPWCIIKMCHGEVTSLVHLKRYMK